MLSSAVHVVFSMHVFFSSACCLQQCMLSSAGHVVFSSACCLQQCMLSSAVHVVFSSACCLQQCMLSSAGHVVFSSACCLQQCMLSSAVHVVFSIFSSSACFTVPVARTKLLKCTSHTVMFVSLHAVSVLDVLVLQP